MTIQEVVIDSIQPNGDGYRREYSCECGENILIVVQGTAGSAFAGEGLGYRHCDLDHVFVMPGPYDAFQRREGRWIQIAPIV